MRFKDLPEKIETEEQNEEWLAVIAPLMIEGVRNEQEGKTDEELNGYITKLAKKIETFEQSFYNI